MAKEINIINKIKNIVFPTERVVPGVAPNELFQEHITKYEWVSKYVNGKTVLDIACGTGYGSSLLLFRGAKRIYGGDISEEAIKFAKEHYRNIDFRVMNAEQLPFEDNFFDVIVSLETLEHLSNPEKFVGEAKRLLKTGGVLIISTPAMRVRNPFHVKEFFTKNELEEMLSSFSNIEFFGQFRKISRIKRLLRLLGLISLDYSISPYSPNHMFMIVVCIK